MCCIAVTLGVVLGLMPAQTQPVVLEWGAAPGLRHARAAHAVACVREAIYAMAGTGSDGEPVLDVEAFDGNQWRDVARMDGSGLNAPAAAAIGDKIYLIGGFETTTNIPTAAVLVFDTKSRTWSAAPSLPEPRGGHAAVVLDGKIHVVGGGNSRSTLSLHSVFDPASNRWSELAPLPRSQGSPAGLVHEGALCMVGGRSGGGDFGTLFVYDASSDSWSERESFSPRATCGAVSTNGRLFVFGGESQSRGAVLRDVDVYSGRSKGWEPATPMPTARSFARAVEFGGAVYVIGGSGAPQTSHGPSGLAVVERMIVPKP